MQLSVAVLPLIVQFSTTAEAAGPIRTAVPAVPLLLMILMLRSVAGVVKEPVASTDMLIAEPLQLVIIRPSRTAPADLHSSMPRQCKHVCNRWRDSF